MKIIPKKCNKRKSRQNAQRKRKGVSMVRNLSLFTSLVYVSISLVHFIYQKRGTPPVMSFMESNELHNARLFAYQLVIFPIIVENNDWWSSFLLKYKIRKYDWPYRSRDKFFVASLYNLHWFTCEWSAGTIS